MKIINGYFKVKTSTESSLWINSKLRLNFARMAKTARLEHSLVHGPLCTINLSKSNLIME